MKSTFTLLILALLSVSCGSEHGEDYFDFDQVDHYVVEVDEGKLFDRAGEAGLSEKEMLEQTLIIGDIPASISDTSFLPKLGSIGFSKNTIKGSKLEEINAIFREKTHKETLATSCIAVYRDVLVFRKKGQIVGLAKVCFGCMMHQIYGTDANTFQFGQSGDYKRLESILKRK